MQRSLIKLDRKDGADRVIIFEEADPEIHLNPGFQVIKKDTAGLYMYRGYWARQSMADGTQEWMPHGRGFKVDPFRPSTNFKGYYKMGARHGFGKDRSGYTNMEVTGFWQDGKVVGSFMRSGMR